MALQPTCVATAVTSLVRSRSRSRVRRRRPRGRGWMARPSGGRRRRPDTEASARQSRHGLQEPAAPGAARQPGAEGGDQLAFATIQQPQPDRAAIGRDGDPFGGGGRGAGAPPSGDVSEAGAECISEPPTHRAGSSSSPDWNKVGRCSTCSSVRSCRSTCRPRSAPQLCPRRFGDWSRWHQRCWLNAVCVGEPEHLACRAEPMHGSFDLAAGGRLWRSLTAARPAQGETSPGPYDRVHDARPPHALRSTSAWAARYDLLSSARP